MMTKNYLRAVHYLQGIENNYNPDEDINIVEYWENKKIISREHLKFKYKKNLYILDFLFSFSFDNCNGFFNLNVQYLKINKNNVILKDIDFEDKILINKLLSVKKKKIVETKESKLVPVYDEDTNKYNNFYKNFGLQ